MCFQRISARWESCPRTRISQSLRFHWVFNDFKGFPRNIVPWLRPTVGDRLDCIVISKVSTLITELWLGIQGGSVGFRNDFKGFPRNMFACHRAASDNRLDCMVIPKVSALIAKLSWGIQGGSVGLRNDFKGFPRNIFPWLRPTVGDRLDCIVISKVFG